jgi:hypothetical protein
LLLYSKYLKDNADNAPCNKDAVYDFLNNPKNDWRKLLLTLSARIIQFYRTLTSDDRVCALIFDDTSFYRNGSKKVELLARVKDHVSGKCFKGFRKSPTAGIAGGLV